MRKFLFLLLACWLLHWPATAQLDTTAGRYQRPIFAKVNVRKAIQYGSALTFTGTTQPLLLDLYEPAGDTVRRRPLVIFAHQGGFVTGTRDEPYMADLCTRFARLGYVAASIDYRLLYYPLDTVQAARAALRGGQDMRAAVRFFRHDAATLRQYRIHPQYVAVGGASAGAFMALQTGYLDKAGEVPAYVKLSDLGGLEGQGGNPGYSSRPLAVLNLSGASESARIVEAGSPPLCSVHGTADTVVPFRAGYVGAGLPAKFVVGSKLLHTRATTVGVPNVLKTLRGAGHVPFYAATPAGRAYADTTFRTIRDFLRPLLGRRGTPLPVAAATLTRALAARADNPAVPIPAEDLVRLILPEDWLLPVEAQLLDAAGRVVRTFNPNVRDLKALRGTLKAGIYSLKFPGQAPVRIEFR